MYELVNTSVPNGLIAGSRGFATVAMTKGTPDAIRSRVEGFCGYPHRTSAHDASYWQENPVNWFHLTLPNGDHVVGRTAPADFDYTGRTNRLARTLCFPSREMPRAGGAFVLQSAESRFCTPWSGEPRFLPKDDLLHGQLGLSSRPTPNPQNWIDLLGERGEDYARRFAQLVANNVGGGNRSVFFKVSTACDRDGKLLLGLFFDLINLLPDAVACQVTFSTFSVCVPGGITCHLRGVFDSDRIFDAASVSQPWVDCENRRVMHEELLPPPLRTVVEKVEPVKSEGKTVNGVGSDLRTRRPPSSPEPQGRRVPMSRQSDSTGWSWKKIIACTIGGLFVAGGVLWGFYQVTKVERKTPSEVNVDALIKSIGEEGDSSSAKPSSPIDFVKSASDTVGKLDESKTTKVTTVAEGSQAKEREAKAREENARQEEAAKRKKKELKTRQEVQERKEKLDKEEARKRKVADAKRKQIEKMAFTGLDVGKMIVEERNSRLDQSAVEKIIERISGVKKEGPKLNAFGSVRQSRSKADVVVKKPVVDAIVVWMWNGKTLQRKVRLFEEIPGANGKTPMDVTLSDSDFTPDLKWVVYWFVDSKVKDEAAKSIETVGVYWQLKNGGKVVSGEKLFEGGKDRADLVARALGGEGAALWRKKFRKAVFLVRWGKHGVYVENALSFTDITKKMTSKINGEIEKQEGAKRELFRGCQGTEEYIEAHIEEFQRHNETKSQQSKLTGTEKPKGKKKEGKRQTDWKEKMAKEEKKRKEAAARQWDILRMYGVDGLESLKSKKRRLDGYNKKITELKKELARISEKCRDARYDAILCPKDPSRQLDEVFELDEKNQMTEQGWE